jgi:hypothetical protein
MTAPSAKLSSGHKAPRSKRRHGQHTTIIHPGQPAGHPFTTAARGSRLDDRHPHRAPWNRSRRRPAHGQHTCRQQRRPVTTRTNPTHPVSREPRAPRPTNYPGGSPPRTAGTTLTDVQSRAVPSIRARPWLDTPAMAAMGLRHPAPPALRRLIGRVIQALSAGCAAGPSDAIACRGNNAQRAVEPTARAEFPARFRITRRRRTARYERRPSTSALRGCPRITADLALGPRPAIVALRKRFSGT